MKCSNLKGGKRAVCEEGLKEKNEKAHKRGGEWNLF